MQSKPFSNDGPQFQCVLLCSVIKTDASRELLDKMKNEFGVFGSTATGVPMQSIEDYDIDAWPSSSVDGGNGGGGGDTGRGPIFIRSTHNTGLWNFRLYKAAGGGDSRNPATRTSDFPIAARFDLCIPFASIESANSAVTGNSAQFAYLRLIFEFLLIVPLARKVPALALTKKIETLPEPIDGGSA